MARLKPCPSERLNRPAGLDSHSHCLPSAEALGYSQPSFGLASQADDSCVSRIAFRVLIKCDNDCLAA